MRNHARFITALLIVAAAAPTARLLADEVAFTKHQLYPHYISEGVSIGDLNGDSHLDVISGSLWWPGPNFKQPHAYKPVKHFPIKGARGLGNYTDNFFTFPDELTADRWGDLILVGIAGRPGQLYVNPAANTFPATNTEQSCPHHAIHQSVCHESPQYLDVIGDERNELLFFTQRRIALAQPDEDATQPWIVSYVSDASQPKSPFVHGLGAGDINGDGLPDILVKDGWWEQPADWDKQSIWTYHPFPFAPQRGGAQMYAYDFNGDGLNDVATALDAHGYGLVWYEQNRGPDSISFTQHVIMPPSPEALPGGVSFSQPHALLCEDVDGDGVKDLITGKTYYAHIGKDPGAEDPAVLYWFKTTRHADETVTFVPHQIDDDSGIGRQFWADDVNADGYLDFVTSNKKGVHLFLQTRE